VRFVCLLFYVLISFPVFAKENIIILGYQNTIENNKFWQNNQVGFGVKNQLRDLIFARHDANILDEKIIDTFNNNTSERLTFNNADQPSWMLQKTEINPQKLQLFAEQYALDAIYWVKILNFQKPRSELTIGLWTSKKITKELTLAICRYSNAKHNVHCETGKGVSSKRSRAFFYKPVDDKKNRKKHFNHSAIGKISIKALEQAFSKLTIRN